MYIVQNRKFHCALFTIQTLTTLTLLSLLNSFFLSYSLPLCLIQEGTLFPWFLVSGAPLWWFLSRVKLVMFSPSDPLQIQQEVRNKKAAPRWLHHCWCHLFLAFEIPASAVSESVESWVWGGDTPIDVDTPVPLGVVSCVVACAGAARAGAFVTWDWTRISWQSSVVWSKLSPSVIHWFGSGLSERSLPPHRLHSASTRSNLSVAVLTIT